jgi:hypothetical protein
MQSVKTTFQERADEVEIYFSFISQFTNSNTNDDLNKILKSNMLLMLYNLVESSMSNAIEEIHANIHNNLISFDVLKIELKEVLISYLKKNSNAKNFVTTIANIANDIVKTSFDKQKIFSGNVDSRKINEISKQYGFDSTTTHADTKNGQCLLTIKNKRNDLAHGTYSFTEIGKEYTIEDLEKMKKETINYLKEILDNIDTYLVNQDYKQILTA